MVRVAPVRLRYNPRTFWFDPGELDLHKDQDVVVETARGREFGTLVEEILDVPDEAIEELSSPLKPVLRIASDEDRQLVSELDERGAEALPIFRELASEQCPDMHPISVEFLLDEAKAVFYFESEERVDFRSLVRELAAHFHVRVDMHQIGVRDKARLVGGLGHCGQEICCKRLGGQFNPVSIRMAKDQDLSLNPQKISGLCGRLMCCLRYESDIYKDFKSRAPKLGSTVVTPEGPAKVTALDTLQETISVSREDDPTVKVPLDAFIAPEEGKRPKVISEAGWQEALERRSPLLSGRLFTEEPAEPVAPLRDEPTEVSEDDKDAASKREKSPRRRHRNRAQQSESNGESAEKKSKTAKAENVAAPQKEGERSGRRKRRKASTQTSTGSGRTTSAEHVQTRTARRRTTIGSSESESTNAAAPKVNAAAKARPTRRVASRPAAEHPRPGHRSSGLRAERPKDSSGKRERRTSGGSSKNHDANASEN